MRIGKTRVRKRAVPALTAALLAALVFAASPVFADDVKSEYIDLQDGKIVSGMENFLRQIQAAERDAANRLHAPKEDEYFRHWKTILTKNIQQLKKRKRIKRAKYEEYVAEIQPHSLKLMFYWGLQKDLKDAARGKKVDNTMINAVRQQGHDPGRYFMDVAATSRPPALKLDEVELRIKLTRPAHGTRYWSRPSGYLPFTLTNKGPDDAKDVGLDVEAIDAFIYRLAADGMSCEKTRSLVTTARCSKDLLARGESVKAWISMDLSSKALGLRRDTDFTRELKMTMTAQSGDPHGKDSASVYFTVRDCASLYMKRLEELEQRKLADFKRDAEKPFLRLPGLPGEILYPHSKGVVSTDILRLGKECAGNQGFDNYLKEEYQPGRPLRDAITRLEDLADSLIESSKPDDFCASPRSVLESVRESLKPFKERLADIRGKALQARDMAEDATKRAAEQIGKMGPSPTLDIPGPRGGRDITGEAEKALFYKVADFLFSESLVPLIKVIQASKVGGYPAFAAGVGKGLGTVTIVTGGVEIAVSTYDLLMGCRVWIEKNDILSLQETSAYLQGLKKRYEDLDKAIEDYAREFEPLFEETCDCVEPF